MYFSVAIIVVCADIRSSRTILFSSFVSFQLCLKFLTLCMVYRLGTPYSIGRCSLIEMPFCIAFCWKLYGIVGVLFVGRCDNPGSFHMLQHQMLASSNTLLYCSANLAQAGCLAGHKAYIFVPGLLPLTSRRIISLL